MPYRRTPPVNRLRDQLTWPSRAAYALWRLTRSTAPVTLTLRSGVTLRLRPAPADDLATAYEIYTMGVYRSPRPIGPDSVRRVVDLGANVGLSCLFLAREFPQARIEAFEPHPVHAALARANLRLNPALAARVDLATSAAGVAAGTTHLTDEGVRSATLASPGATSLAVPVVDILAALRSQPCDLLKMDVEGSEYAIFADARFQSLLARIVVVEWHPVDGANGEEVVRAHLGRAGYEVESGVSYGHMGILWGYASRDMRGR